MINFFGMLQKMLADILVSLFCLDNFNEMFDGQNSKAMVVCLQLFVYY